MNTVLLSCHALQPMGIVVFVPIGNQCAVGDAVAHAGYTDLIFFAPGGQWESKSIRDSQDTPSLRLTPPLLQCQTNSLCQCLYKRIIPCLQCFRFATRQCEFRRAVCRNLYCVLYFLFASVPSAFHRAISGVIGKRNIFHSIQFVRCNYKVVFYPVQPYTAYAVEQPLTTRTL